MDVSASTAAQLSHWYATFNCSCPSSARLQRLFGSLGGGVSASKIRSTGTLAATALSSAPESLPDRVAEVMSGVLLERSLATPHVAVSLFGLEKSVTYCGCNAVRPNYSLATMMVWPEGAGLKITCPECSVLQATGAGAAPIALPAFLRQRARAPCDNPARETRSVYGTLISASGGCGRSVHQRCQLSTFRGTWTSLVVVENGLDAEFLVSNAVGCSLRLQQRCICSDLLYAVAPLTARNPGAFAFGPLCVSVLGGGEYLYCRYTVFRVGGVLDRPPTAAVSDVFAVEPVSSSESVRREARQRLAAASSGGPRKKAKRSKTRGSNNVVNLQLVLKSALSGGTPQCRGHAAAAGSAEIDRLHEAAHAAAEARSSGEAAELVLPPPAIRETDVADYLRKLRSERTSVPLAREGGCGGGSDSVEMMNVDVAKTPRSPPFFPPVCNLVSPPLVRRASFNAYDMITGTGAFFDRIEAETGPSRTSVALDDTAVHGAFFELLALVQDNQLAGSDASIVDVPAASGIAVSRSELADRQLSKDNVLSMLASIIKSETAAVSATRELDR